MAVTVLARFKVRDYQTWREHFDAGVEIRQNGGSLGAHIFYNSTDPTDVTVNLQWDDGEKALTFLNGPEAQKARDAAGIIGSVDLWLVEDGGRTAG
jgi:quinol monooxygenase YgiN